MLNYDRINKAIFKYYFTDRIHGEYVFLSMDDFDLKEIANSLKSTPKEILLELKLTLRDGWKKVLKIQSDQTPYFLGLIALQTYAAYKMQNDAQFTERAFNPRLLELLGYEKSDNQSIQRLFKDCQELLWSKYKKWLEKNQLLHNIPKKKQGAWKYVQYPLSQAFFNSWDLKILTGYFDHVGLDAYDAIHKDDFFQLIELNSIPDRFLTPHSKKIISNPDIDNPLLKEQIFSFYQVWDGKIFIPIPKDGDREDEHLTIMQPRPRLSMALDSNFKTIRIFDEKNTIINDFKVKDGLISDIRKSAYKPPWFHQDGIIIFIKDEQFEDYLESRYIQTGDDIIILTTLKTSIKLKAFILKYAKRVYIGSQFELYQLKIDGHIKSGVLEKYAKSKRISSLLIYGLKLSRNIWMEGAGPDLLLPSKTKVWINGKPVVENDAVIRLRNCEEGRYAIKIKGYSPYVMHIQKPAQNIKEDSIKSGWKLELWQPCSSEPTLSGIFFSDSILNKKPNPHRAWINLNIGRNTNENLNKTVLKALKRSAYGIRKV